jgi:hypothetical protein
VIQLPGVADNRSFVQLATYYSVAEAELARTHLAGSGVEARLDGQHTVSMLPLHAIAFGGVKLLVHPDELARAREILASTAVHPDATADDEARAASAEATSVDDGDRWMKQAAFAAFLGISACPLVGTAYAIVLVLRYGSLPRSASGTLLRRAAIFFIALAVGFTVLWRARSA